MGKKISIASMFLLIVMATLWLGAPLPLARAASGQDEGGVVVPTKSSPSFSDAVEAEKKEVSPSPTQEQLSGGSAAARAPFATIKVERAAGENAFAVAEICAKSTLLNGKTVRVRGQVVRFNPAIMGKNWIHLRDGSGSAEANTDDILVTTRAQAQVGAVITVRGPVHTNKDFGAGYVYQVLIEDASVSK